VYAHRTTGARDGRAIELHVLWVPAEGLVAWWCTASGLRLGFAEIGHA
jgi:hypothetical protein